MKHWIYEKPYEPDSVEEWLEMIWAIGVDYDGYNTVNSLKSLIDEMINMSKKARKCLYENKLFPQTKKV